MCLLLAFLLSVTYRSGRRQSFAMGEVQVGQGWEAPDSTKGQPPTAGHLQVLQLAQPGCTLQDGVRCQHTG